MSGYNLPEGLSKADMAHINGDDGGYDDWRFDNEEMLEKQFFEKGYAKHDLDKHFDRFCEAVWESLLRDRDDGV